MLKQSLSFLLAAPLVCFAAAPNSLNSGLSVVPSLTNTTLRSDSETAVTWEVTNHESVALSAMHIIPDYHPTGQGSGFTIQNNSCQTLAPGASCQFSLVISGRQQPSQFQVTPLVCGADNTQGGEVICFQSALAQPLEVSVDQINHPAYAYITTAANVMIPFNVQNQSLGNTLSGLFSFNDWNGLAVSPDGNTVYFMDGGNKMLRIASGGQNPQLLSSLSISGTAGAFIAISPNGQRAYLPDGPMLDVDVVNIQNPATPSLMTTITDVGRPDKVVPSPDGSKIYVLNTDPEDFHHIAVVNTSDYHHVIDNIALDFDHGIGPDDMAINPNGLYLYALGLQGDSGNLTPVLAVINTETQAVSYIDLNLIGGATSLTVSPDGSTVYVGGAYGPGFETIAAIDAVNAQTGAVNRIIPQEAGASIIGGVMNLKVTPDGSHIIFMNFGDKNVYEFPITKSDATVAIPMGDTTEGSQGNFVG